MIKNITIRGIRLRQAGYFTISDWVFLCSYYKRSKETPQVIVQQLHLYLFYDTIIVREYPIKERIRPN